MDKNRDFHAIEALTIATNEVISLGLIQWYEVFAFCPISNCPICSAVVIPSFVHLKHIVLVFNIPECYIPKGKKNNPKIITSKESERK